MSRINCMGASEGENTAKITRVITPIIIPSEGENTAKITKVVKIIPPIPTEGENTAKITHTITPIEPVIVDDYEQPQTEGSLLLPILAVSAGALGLFFALKG